MKKSRKTNVLLIYEQLIASVRLCGYEQLRYLELEGMIRFQHGLDTEITAGQCQWADILVFVRSAAWLDYKIALENKKRGKLIVYVLDDDLLHLPAQYASSRYYEQASVRHRIWWFLKNSDVLASPSAYLLEKYKSCTGRAIRMEEPCLKNEISETNRQAAGIEDWTSRKLKIGFAGSIDRGGESAEILQEALVRFY